MILGKRFTSSLQPPCFTTQSHYSSAVARCQLTGREAQFHEKGNHHYAAGTTRRDNHKAQSPSSSRCTRGAFYSGRCFRRMAVAATLIKSSTCGKPKPLTSRQDSARITRDFAPHSLGRRVDTMKITVTTKKALLAGLLAAAVACLPSCGKPTSVTTKAAERIVDCMAKGDFASATTGFNAVMKTMLPSQRLGQAWTRLESKVGRFKERTGTRQAQEQGFNIVYVTCKLEKANVDVKVVFDSNNQVAGLYMLRQPSGGK